MSLIRYLQQRRTVNPFIRMGLKVWEQWEHGWGGGVFVQVRGMFGCSQALGTPGGRADSAEAAAGMAVGGS